MNIKERIEYYEKIGMTTDEINKELELEITLGLKPRTANVLKRSGLNTIKKLQTFYNEHHGDHSLLSLRNLGKKSLIEIKIKCEKTGIELKNDNPRICQHCGAKYRLKTIHDI